MRDAPRRHASGELEEPHDGRAGRRTARGARACARRCRAARPRGSTTRGGAGCSPRRSPRRGHRAATWATSAAVHGPTPGVAVSSAAASEGAREVAPSRRRACHATARDRLGAAALDPAAVQRPVRRLGEPRRVGGQHHGAGAGGRLGVPADEAAVGPAGLDARDLLVDDRRDQRLDDHGACHRAACLAAAGAGHGGAGRAARRRPGRRRSRAASARDRAPRPRRGPTPPPTRRPARRGAPGWPGRSARGSSTGPSPR